MIAARAAGPDRAPALVAAVAGATAARALIGGSAPAGSVPAALVFTAILASSAVLGGARISRVPRAGVTAGLLGGALLVALSVLGVTVMIGPRAPAATLAWWVPLVTVVAATEELVFRGVLFEAVRARSSSGAAVALTATLFALIHLPLYGPSALAVDLCVGVFLGFLRVASGGVTAPLVAHVVADVATGWLG